MEDHTEKHTGGVDKGGGGVGGVQSASCTVTVLGEGGEYFQLHLKPEALYSMAWLVVNPRYVSFHPSTWAWLIESSPHDFSRRQMLVSCSWNNGGNTSCMQTSAIRLSQKLLHPISYKAPQILKALSFKPGQKGQKLSACRDWYACDFLIGTFFCARGRARIMKLVVSVWRVRMMRYTLL